MSKSKKPTEKHEFPLNEDYREVGKEFEFDSDKEREEAREASQKPKKGK